jgi:peptidoglycan-associated lipoprotein
VKKIVFSTLLLSLLAACSSQDVKEQPMAPVESRAPTTTDDSAQSQGAATADVSGAQLNPLKDPANILSQRSVYYDLDKYDVRDEFKPMVEAHAKYLSSTPAAQVVIIGNCDERGSREYNIALGHKRAEGVRKIMNVLGVGEKQIETVSFGKEKPRATCHDESCWKENRRSDLVYQGE